MTGVIVVLSVIVIFGFIPVMCIALWLIFREPKRKARPRFVTQKPVQRARKSVR